MLRDYIAGPRAPVGDEVLDAFRTMIAFRETFQVPLNKTVMGLRSMTQSEVASYRVATGVPVVQRLKRREQMIYKLTRFPNSRLSNMGDIGGCRVVVPDRLAADGVLRRIRRNWDLHGVVRDTRDVPADTGYRALHVIVVRDGRRIEIQLRTPREHEWAVAVERTGVRLGYRLKEGEGPAELMEYFRLASDGIYMDATGIKPSSDFLDRFEAARDAVRPYFNG